MAAADTKAGLGYRTRLLRADLLRSLINGAGPALEILRVGPPEIGADDYIEQATQRTGLRDFGHPALRAALESLIESVRSDARLNYFGRLTFHFDTLRLLANLLWTAEFRARNPAVTSKPIPKPVFITGLPRTASSFLQTLFMQDPANRCPRVWEVAYPRPAARRGLAAGAGWERKVRRELGWLNLLEPDFQNVHPLRADSPQECTEILSNVLESLRFDSTYDVPSYRGWLDGRSGEEAYAFHRRFLQQLQFGSEARRWVLKSPDHIFFADAILHTYPDARIVLTHRDPARVIPSVAAQTMVLHGLFSDKVDADAVTRKVLERWITGSEKLVELSRLERDGAYKFAHVFYEDLVRDPPATMEALYRSLELPFSTGFKNRLREHLGRSGAGKYRGNRYETSIQALSRPDDVRSRFAPYITAFDIRPET